MRIGQPAKIAIDALPDRSFKGHVTEIGNSPIQTTSTATTGTQATNFKVVVTLENPSQRLKPGLSASADIITAQKKGVLAVPISSLVLRDKPAAAGDRPDAKKEEEGVYTVENSRVKFQAVEKGISGGMSMEITAGLKENQDIVTGPYASLRELKDGILIKTEPKKDAKTS